MIMIMFILVVCINPHIKVLDNGADISLSFS